MKDIFFCIDQQLANKLTENLSTPLTINIKNDIFFVQGQPNISEISTTEKNNFEDDIHNMSLKALEYAEDRVDDLQTNSQEDQELFELAQNVVNAYLEVHPAENTDNSFSMEKYSHENSLGLWKKVKKFAKKAWNWIKKQAVKIFKVVKFELENLDCILLNKPSIKLSKEVKIDDINLNIKYKVRVKYEIFGRPGSIAFADNFRISNTALTVLFKVDGLKYNAHPIFRNLDLVKYILGFKITIPLAWLANYIIKPQQIFDATKYLPEIPWFGKSFVVNPPLYVGQYATGIEFGVEFKVK